jgi:uncharacterized Tic20 family protein
MEPPAQSGGAPPGNRPRHADAEDAPYHATVADDEARFRPQRSRVTADDRTMAMFCHLSGIVSGFIGPLIIWLIKKDESRFVDHHGRTALNFAFTLAIAVVVAWLGGVVLTVVTCGVGVFIILPLVLGVLVFGLVFWIIGAVKANQGEWYRQPMAIPFIPPPTGGWQGPPTLPRREES